MVPNIVFLGKTFPIYLIMAVIGIFVIGIYLCKKCRRIGIDENDVIITMLFAAIGVLIGSHFLYGVTQINLIIDVLNNLDAIVNFKTFVQVAILIFGGSVFYGGLIGGLIAAYIYIKKTNKDLNLYANTIAPAIPLFHFFGRIGCFLGGCCYGVESHIGFVYHYSPMEQANGVSRFPIQLVEAVLNLILFLVLIKLEKKEKLKNHILQIYLMSYACIRFCTEMFRGDEIRGFFLGFSTSQCISMLLFVITLSSLIYQNFQKKQKLS